MLHPTEQLRIGDTPDRATAPSFLTDERIDRMRRTLEYLADTGNWLGDPRRLGSVLVGPDTPFEMARDALRG